MVCGGMLSTSIRGGGGIGISSSHGGSLAIATVHLNPPSASDRDGLPIRRAVCAPSEGTRGKWCGGKAHRPGDQAPDDLRHLDKVWIGTMCVAGDGLASTTTG